jgi:exosortase A-associated hydrolase 2
MPKFTDTGETPFYFDNAGYRLFGVLHPPAENGRLAGHAHGLVFSSPFAEEKMIAHRVMVNMARYLAAQGVACLRFDYMGEGDSEGSFEASSITTRLSDISAALSILTEATSLKSIGLLGVRFGATLAALAAAKNRLDSLILISPIITGKPYLEQALRSNLAAQLAAYGNVLKDRHQLTDELMNGTPVNIDGYLLGKEHYLEMSAIDLLETDDFPAGRILLLDVSKKDAQPSDPDMNGLYQKLRKADRDVTMSIIREAPFWKDSKVYSPVSAPINNVLADWLREKEAE